MRRDNWVNATCNVESTCDHCMLSSSSRPAHAALTSLPLLTLYLTERCNSRCVSCDYWQHGKIDMTVASVERILPSLGTLGTRVVLISGGEPFLHHQWAEIAQLLRSQGLAVWLLTSGLSLAKHARQAAQLFESITVSLDGADRDTYAKVRGLDAFDRVCLGIRAAVELQVLTTIRVTVQRSNFRQLPRIVDLAKRLGAKQISFLAADVSTANAFGRVAIPTDTLSLTPEDLPQFELILANMMKSNAADFTSGFIAESPSKLLRLLQYYSAVNGRGDFPAVRCNAPEFSCVVEADGKVRPCFFISGTDAISQDGSLDDTLNSAGMTALRASIRAGERSECKTCVCSMWRDQLQARP